ncbi:MAG: VanZ family protein, partial [Candidatus Obscuribacterales bacterium]|nr:VanZ family protein [Candidatus Obscuribacterales bacterium]
LSFQNTWLESKSERRKLRYLIPLVFSCLYAISDEWHQSFVPGRTALASDVLIDTCGASIAAVAVFIRNKLSK